MDLRTKLVFALVAASLLSMAALGTIAYLMADERLTQKTEEQLATLAEAKVEDLENVLEGWEDRVALIASRTELRASLDAYGAGTDGQAVDRIERILRDVLEASDAVRSVTAHGLDGRAVARVRRDGAPEPAGGGVAVPPVDEGVRMTGIDVPSDGLPVVHYVAPLAVDGRAVGALRVSIGTRDLVELTDDAVGLGATGETMVVVRDSTGTARVLTPLRAAPPPPPEEGSTAGRAGAADPVELAFRGVEGPLTEGLVDYRGEPVWAAMRLLPDAGWAVVVKFDAAEERRPVVEFRGELLKVGFALSAFAVLLGTLLGLRFARPIHDLADVANRIRMGELDARAEVTREDELGLLGLTFNEMGEELERRMTLLREYKTFFERSPDLLCVAQTDGYFKRVNPAFEKALGWSEEELLDRPFVEFVHPDDVEATLRETQRLAEGVPTISFQNRYRRKDGSWQWLQWTCYPDPDTDLLYAVARTVPGPADD